MGDDEDQGWTEGLRERKKRLTRSLISDTATAMFLEQGFDAVKVVDVAEACGVSEKTVYNYFPTKESLLLDREPEMAAAIWRALGPDSPDRSPVAAILELVDELFSDMQRSWREHGIELFRRFVQLVDATPSVQAAQRDMAERIERTAVEALAERMAVSPEDPEPRMAAVALMGIVRIFYSSTTRCALEGLSAEMTARTVNDDVQRAARVVESGLWSFGAVVGRAAGRQQFKTAAEAAQAAGQQVVAAVRQARAAWEQMQREADRRPAGGDGPNGIMGLLEQKERWMRDLYGQQDEWTKAYRDQQAQLREAQRELQRRFRQAGQSRHGQGRPRSRRRDAPGGAPPST